jgi:hypothetical protein
MKTAGQFFVVFLLIWNTPLGAQDRETADGRKQAVALRVTNGAIEVDGRLTESVWEEARAITDFVQKEPIEGAPPTEKMEIRLIYDDDAFYVGARMYKTAGSVIQAPIGRRDRGEDAEHLLVALDTFHDRRTAYVFGVTASGVRLDHFHPQDDEANFDEGYDPVWAAKTTIDELGWVAELWIPFSQLRFNDGVEQVWGLNVSRFTPTLDEADYWAPVPRTVTAWSSRFGDLTGIQGLRSLRRIELLPYVAEASTVTAVRDSANPFDRGGNFESRTGADLKMGIGPNLTLDATFNPDFGQVEADPAEVNLSGFESFFTEKRPFFTEGAGLLNLSTANNWFFYSRRIGALPNVPVAGDFVDRPQRATILAAGKLTGRLASGMSLGVLTALTGEETARVSNRASGEITNVRIAPRTEYFVGRVQQEFGQNHSTTSGMVAVSHRNFMSGDPLAALLVRNGVNVAGDAVVRLKGGEYLLTAIGAFTYNEGDPASIARVQRSSVHYFQRPDREYSRYDPTRTSIPGFRVGGGIQRIGGRHWLWNFSPDYQSPGLNSNEIGRIANSDGNRVLSELRYRETVPGKVLRAYSIGGRQRTEWTRAGNVQAATYELFSNQTWKNFWTTDASYIYNGRTMSTSLTRGGPLMEGPAGWRARLLLRNRAASQTSWSGEINLTDNEDGGFSHAFTSRFAFRPGPRWQLSMDPSFSRQVDTQQYVTTLAGGRPEVYGSRYIFARIDRSTYAVQFRLTYTFKPDVTLDVYAEPFAASGRYGDLGELAAPSTRARRIYGIAAGTTASSQPDGSLLVTDGSAAFRLANNNFNVRSFRSNVVLRWEYRPGSTLHVVWQQDRYASEPIGDRIGFGDPFRSLSAPGDNYFIIKTSFWLPVK